MYQLFTRPDAKSEWKLTKKGGYAFVLHHKKLARVKGDMTKIVLVKDKKQEK